MIASGHENPKESLADKVVLMFQSATDDFKGLVIRVICSKSKRHPSRNVVHILARSRLLEEISREEVGVISREHDVSVNSPFQCHLRLVAYVSCIAGPA